MVTIVLIVVLDRLPYINKVSLLVALVVASALVPLLNLTTVPLVSSLGAMPDSLPRPVLPDRAYIPGLIAPAFALTIIALAVSAGVSSAYTNPDGKYPDASRDFSGQGAANLAGALVQAVPAGGSLSGTAMLVKGGAQSRWANIFTGVFAAIIILLLGDFIGKIALSALAGLLMVVGFQTIKFGEIKKIARTSNRARWLMIATFGATLIVPLQWAIFFGVAASFVVFAYRESESTTIVEVVSNEGGIPIEQPAPTVLPSNKVTLLHAYGSLFFAGARNLEEDLPQADETHNAVVILSLRGHTELGSTFINVLERYAQTLQANGNMLMLVSVSKAVREQLEDTDSLKVFGMDNVFVTSKPGESTLKAYEKAQQLIQN
jgi:sulfate permease, SulP family